MRRIHNGPSQTAIVVANGSGQPWTSRPMVTVRNPVVTAAFLRDIRDRAIDLVFPAKQKEAGNDHAG